MLGVALVVDDVRKGPKLAFSYPLTLSAAAAAASRDGGDRSHAGDYFARLFRPKAPLCNAPLVLTVNELVFVSYPVTIAPAPSQARPAATTARAPDAEQPELSVSHASAGGTCHDRAEPASAASIDSLLDDGIHVVPDDDTPAQVGALGAAGVTLFNVVFIVDPRREIQRARSYAPDAVSGDGSPQAAAPLVELVPAPAASPVSSASGVHRAPSDTRARTGPVRVATGDEKDLTDTEIVDTLLRGLTDAAQRVAACLLYEEGRCGYVSRQSQLLLHSSLSRPGFVPLTPMPSASSTSTATSSSAAPSALLRVAATDIGPSTGPGPAFAPDADVRASSALLDDAVLSMFPELQFSLPWELATIYHRLRDGLGSVCHLRINNYVAVSLSLSTVSPNAANTPFVTAYGADTPQHPAFAQPRDAERAADVMLQSPGVAGPSAPSDTRVAVAASKLIDTFPHMMPFRPYHTLLLLEDADIILKALPTDSSPQLVQLVLVASPTISFNQLQGETGIPSSQLLRLAAHLVHWGLAIIVNVITRHSVYTVSPNAELHPSSALATEFHELYGDTQGDDGRRIEGFTLASMLALFSHTNKLDVLHTAASVPSHAHSVGRTAPPGPTGPLASVSASSSTRQPLPSDWMAHHRTRAGPASGMSAPVATDAPSSKRAPDAHSHAKSADVDEELLRHSIASLRELPRLAIGCGIPLSRLMAAMPAARARKFVSAVTWLLKHGFLRQMHTYVYLVWPWPLVPAVGADGAAAESWKPEEKQYLHHLVRGKPAHLATEFVRIVAYQRETMLAFGPSLDESLYHGDAAARSVAPFQDDIYEGDGMHAILRLALRLEEIMWRLRMSRAEVTAVLNAFPEVLVTSIHE